LQVTVFAVFGRARGAMPLTRQERLANKVAREKAFAARKSAGADTIKGQAGRDEAGQFDEEPTGGKGGLRDVLLS
jgi:hypothetical protein